MKALAVVGAWKTVLPSRCLYDLSKGIRTSYVIRACESSELSERLITEMASYTQVWYLCFF